MYIYVCIFWYIYIYIYRDDQICVFIAKCAPWLTNVLAHIQQKILIH